MLFHYQAGRYFLYTQPTDMRKGFDALCGTVYNEMKRNPLNGDLYIFINRTRRHIKMLHWQGDGYAIFYKRLEKGTYELLLSPVDETTVSISAENLLFILQGVVLKSVKKRKRYSHSLALAC
jgi:transposase